MNYELLVNTVITAGEIMLSSGAETYRVEDTMSKMLKVSGLRVTETMVTTTCIYVTLSDKTINTITQIRRVNDRNINLEKIYEVNEVSRQFCSHRITLEEAYEKLKEIRRRTTYKNAILYFCMIVTAACFTVVYGGKGLDFCIGAINGVILALCMFVFHKVPVNVFLKNMISGFLVTISSVTFYTLYTSDLHLTILLTGSITPLVPGVAITNAIRDTFHGDYMSGGARAIEAFVAAAAIAVGVGLGLAVFDVNVLL